MAAPTFASELGKCKYTDLLNDVKYPNIYIEKLPSSKLFTTFAIDFLNKSFVWERLQMERFKNKG